MTFQRYEIPVIRNFAELGVAPDAWVRPMLENPTPEQREGLRVLRVPTQAYGTPEAVASWCARGGREGMLR